MLEKIVIKNIALIESAEIEFENSLNVLTGETGAGKSILLDSIGLLLGDRIDKNLLRKGAEDCKVTGKFNLNNNSLNFFKNFCDKYDLEFDEDLIITRSYNIDGKSSIKINGQMVTLSMLRELCSNLVNTYGQNENQIIFNTDNHLKILDAFAETIETDSYKKYIEYYAELKRIENKLKEFGGSDEERLRQIDLLSYQVEEIENAKISFDDYEELKKRRQILLNIGKVVSNTTMAQNYLNEELINNITKAKNSIDQASIYDLNLSDFSERLNSARIEIEDIFDSLKIYNQNYDFSEEDQEQIEDRYSLYNNLMRKYGNSVENILIELEKMKTQLLNLKNADEIITKLTLQKQKLVSQLLDLGLQIRQYRTKYAGKLCDLIEKNLQNLNMKNAKLKFNFEQNDKLLNDGIDRVELLFSANLGEEEKPLSKIASGGEISRFMLALKSVIASQDEMPTMIFDEIDTGISGLTSEAVAKQMAIIAKSHQVIVVTHSQQIASMADTNFLIEKLENGDRTITLVKKLNYDEKVVEIARFMSGDRTNEAAIKNAKALIEEQDIYKKSLEKFDN